jgi:hypothetical protein
MQNLKNSTPHYFDTGTTVADAGGGGFSPSVFLRK